MNSRKELREQARRQRDAMDEAVRREASDRICSALLQIPEYEGCGKIFSYCPMGSEADVLPFLRKALRDGKTLAMPKVLDRKRMAFYPVRDLDALVSGPFGLREPAPVGEGVTPDNGDLILVPCLLYTDRGDRIGYGGGYYDRWLGKYTDGTAYLCAFSLQKAVFDTETHDVSIPWIVTEKGICHARGGEQ